MKTYSSGVFYDVNNQYSYSYVKGLNGTAVVWRILRLPRVIQITVFVILEKK